jgi:glycosyltransferase involved in cell wall biosynthesis
MPNAVLEAMACGCPLVVSDIPEHREILDQDSALFVDPHQPDAIARGILQVLQQPQKEQHGAICARHIASAWSVPSIVQQYADLYENVLSYT